MEVARQHMIGFRSGRLVVARQGAHIGRALAWVCRCDCGRERAFRTGDLKGKRPPTHCGCQNRKPVIRPCKMCGAAFEVKKSDPKVYCTLACYRASRPQRLQAECKLCGRPFSYQPSESQKTTAGRRQYCGRSCSREAKKQTEPLAVRFWRHVEKTDGCWVWNGGSSGSGYGAILRDDKTIGRAHRIAWELTRGPIPSKLFVCHHCDNPACVRPDHLFLGTAKDNAQDRENKGRGHIGSVWPATADGKLNAGIVWALRLIGRHKLATLGEMSKRFRLSRGAIQRAVSGKTWKHVE